MTTWILVSDASRAKLFSTELREHDWKLLEEFDHPEGRETSSEIRPSSPPGKSKESSAPGAHHTAFQPRTTPKEAEAERFAHLLGEHLNHAVERSAFDHLVLVAPPHMLGVLREKLKNPAASRLRTTVNKDLAMLGAADLRERLLDTVFPIHPA
jgi:protein required for attachment to host cells